MTALTCPLCLADVPVPALPADRDGQRALDRALWAAIHALQDQAAVADRLRDGPSARAVAAELHEQVDLLHAVLSSRSRA